MSTIIPISELKNHKRPKSAWIIIHNNVYDVSRFLSEHPGGEQVLLDVAGTDATQAFEDVGHSEDARVMLKQYKIGCLSAEETIVHVGPCDPPRKGKSPPSKTKGEPHLSCIVVPKESRWWLWALLALGMAAGGAFAYKKYAT